METPSRRNNVENVTQPNTLLETPPSGIEITPQDIIGNTTVEASPNRKSRVALKFTAGVAALLAAGGATAYALGIGRDNPQEGTRPVPADTGNPTGEASPKPSVAESDPESTKPDSIEAVLSDPNRIKPEEVANMNQEQLMDLATITIEEAPTPDAYAREYIRVLDIARRAGSTENEYAPFKHAAANSFEDAMASKYEPAFTEGLYAGDFMDQGINKVHIKHLNAYGISQLLDPSKPYDAAQQFVSSQTVSEDENGFTVEITSRIVDNIEESSASATIGRKDTDEVIKSTVTVQNINGTRKAVSIDQ